MTGPDVILDEDRTKVVGELHLTVDSDQERSVSLDPSGESIRVGRVDGDTTAEIGRERIEVATLRSGELELGGGRDYQDEGRVTVHRGGDQDVQPRPGVDIKGGGKTGSSEWPAGIGVYDDGNRAVSIGPDHITMEDGEIQGPERIESTSSIQVGAATSGGPSRRYSKDGDSSDGTDPEYRAGEITVKGDSGSDGEAETTASIEGAASGRDGASASLFHEDGLRTVDLDGGTGRLLLGGHRGDGITGVAAGENGTVVLADGAGSFFTVSAEDGTLSIGLEGTGPLFEIDSTDETIRTKYDVEPGAL